MMAFSLNNCSITTPAPSERSPSVDSLVQSLYAIIFPTETAFSLDNLFQYLALPCLNPQVPLAIHALLSSPFFPHSPWSVYHSLLQSALQIRLHHCDRLLYNKWLQKYDALISPPLNPSFTKKLSKIQAQVEQWLQHPPFPLPLSLQKIRFLDDSHTEQPSQDWGDFAGHWALELDEEPQESPNQDPLPSPTLPQVSLKECQSLQEKLSCLALLAQEAQAFQKNIMAILNDDSSLLLSDLQKTLDDLFLDVSLFLMSSKMQKIPDLWNLHDLSQAIMFYREVTKQKITQIENSQPLLLSPFPLRPNRSHKDLHTLLSNGSPISPHSEIRKIYQKICKDPRALSDNAYWLFLGQSLIASRGYQEDDLEEICLAISQQIDLIPSSYLTTLEFYQYILDSFRPFFEKYGTPAVLVLFQQCQNELCQKSQDLQSGDKKRPW